MAELLKNVFLYADHRLFYFVLGKQQTVFRILGFFMPCSITSHFYILKCTVQKILKWLIYMSFHLL